MSNGHEAAPQGSTAGAAAPAAAAAGATPAAPAAGATPATPAGSTPPVTPPVAAVKERKGKDGAAAESGKTAEPVYTPDTYKDVKFPEGLTRDEAMFGEFAKIAAGARVSVETAQALVELQGKALAAQHAANQKAWDDLKSQWRNEAAADKEIGGNDHANKVSLAKAAVKRVGGDKAAEIFDQLGLFDHPEGLRLAFRLSKELEPGKVMGSAGQQAISDRQKELDARYPSMRPKS